ncbi:MAG: rRNA maturation RNase YbeY [Candidatus Vogelbacteria bacterium]|nr:rRNA maturation RNase YbeY [Candidatus Vogelbacteria bacterium]
MLPNLEITNTTKRNAPSIPFVAIKEKILGAKYDLSLVFTGNALIHKLNKIYRHKDKPTNILSFPLTENAGSPASRRKASRSGEIFINLTQANQEFKKYLVSKDEHLTHLLIHGLLHLKGWRHSSKMESEEKKYLKIFKTNDQKPDRRIRYGNRVGSARSLRAKARR